MSTCLGKESGAKMELEDEDMRNANSYSSLCCPYLPRTRVLVESETED